MNKQKYKPLSPENYIRTRARTLHIGNCYINHDWRETGFAMIIVSRYHINGNITHASFMVDLYCLGVKEAFWCFNQDPLDFDRFVEKVRSEGEYSLRFAIAEYRLVHNIIYGAVEFAGEYGFPPHKSFELAKHILEEDDEHVKLIEIEFGYKGKPLYISGPDKPAPEQNRVLAHLDRTIGRDNFYFIAASEANDFFDTEFEEESKKFDYHNPEVQKKLIEEFLVLTLKVPKILQKKPEQMWDLLDAADIIFHEYMITEEERSRALKSVELLFDFRITTEIFSDDALFGGFAPRDNKNKVRLEAERLLKMSHNEQYTEGIRETERMIRQYPEVPVFHYLYMRFVEIKSGTRALLPELEEYLSRFPGYLPLLYLYETAKRLSDLQSSAHTLPENLHLKNFFPGRTAFSREEVLLYIHLLIMSYGFSDQGLMVEMIDVYMQAHHPGIMPDDQIIMAKIAKLPKVTEWCEVWLEENQSTI
ncbi:MAG: hypothetical protein NTW16_11970 [Bacteroidetes bacterium]|nr:hypothetical protein [Bacteroidota bacterium]